MILGALRTLLLSITDVTDIVSDRIYPYSLPMGETIPAIDMRVVTSDTFGYSGGTSGLFLCRVTLDCYSKKVQEADQIASAIMSPQSSLAGYQGVVGGVYVRDVQIDSGITNSEDGVDPGSDEHRYVSSITLAVTWCQACR